MRNVLYIYIGLGFMVVKPHPVAMIQTPSGEYSNRCLIHLYTKREDEQYKKDIGL